MADETPGTEAFEQMVALLDYPMFLDHPMSIVTTSADGELAGCLVGHVLSPIDMGDHLGFLLEPVEGSTPRHFEQLVTIADVRDLDPGHDA